MSREEVLIELDERRRASLGRVGRPEHRRYLAKTDDDGTITMRPVDVVPAMPTAPAPPMVGQHSAMLAPARAHPDLDAAEGIARLREQLRRGGRRVIEP